MFSIIAAVGKNNELGLNGQLVFHIKEDMAFFKATTLGHAVLMGSKTFFSLPKALPGRTNYVVTSQPNKLPAGVIAVKDLGEFIKRFEGTEEEVFVIGGAKVYAEMLPHATNLYLTEIDKVTEADTFFPTFDKHKYDRIELKKGQTDDLNYTFAKYVKK